MRRPQTTPGSRFRLIRAFTPEHNVARLRHYAAQLARQVRGDVCVRRARLKARRQRQAAA
ncbi:MAG TPA: hypothetical protein VLI72_09245 [Methylibium sp.]|nr:hypothetical protein [Methylibium sp.]